MKSTTTYLSENLCSLWATTAFRMGSKSLHSVLLFALLCAALVAVGWRQAAMTTAMQNVAAPVQLASGHVAATNVTALGSSYSNAGLAQSADEPFQIDVTLSGVVDLSWGAQGTYTDTWPAAAVNTLTEDAPIDITFLVMKGAGNAVTAYVELENSLVFTATGSISTTVAGDTSGNNGAPAVVTREVGPRATGVLAGNQLTLLSERIAYTTESGQTVERQFRLTANPDNAANALTGEYRETIWGLTYEPLTVGGPFTLRAPAAAVENTNRAPVANGQTVATTANTAKAITLTGSDQESDPLTYAIVTAPTRGTLSGLPPNVTYTPRTDFAGSDSFTFKVNDGQVDSDAVAVSITVEGGPNRAPTALADAATTTASVAVTINVLANDSDPDGDTLTVTILQQPEHGSAQVNGSTIIYTPDAGYSGTDVFVYTVTDSKGATASASITITITQDENRDSPAIYLPLIHNR